ncbi:hypothetical protein [Luteipulveratus mongoliensis]|uniref:Uncharacterized protein n=1 Tax=Luteipulveratus mongoliensis TaxID=571913 RepID=A0A0K1JH73_9MICO|nr:hypothetical protein [Luteipulveratus mongoliensis]AKU15935.1 hypothetical protein VV02_08830 [Luteipulveratus mongoliensis]
MTQTQPVKAAGSRSLRRGDRVRVRPIGDVLATLDADGDNGGLPFMPEMLPMCGQTFEVAARADKTCDTINLTGCSREMDDTVHLVEARCDGSAHGGCDAGCLFFFKEEWLESANGENEREPHTGVQDDQEAALATLESHTMSGPTTYRCQATQVPEASRPMEGIGHFVKDISRRNVPLPVLRRGLRNAAFDRYQAISRGRLPAWARIRGGEELPDVRGTLKKTPTELLDLMPGELVEVKSLEEIRATLSVNQRNRNLWFDREMVKYCGRQFRVLKRVERLLDEKTGEMLEPKTVSIILDGAVCVGDFHKLCPRQDYTFFREIWLRRVGAPAVGTP